MSATETTIYTLGLCPYCDSAKALLSKKGLPFEEIRVDGNSELRSELRERSGGATSLPQIFIGNRHIGGRDALFSLEKSGELDSLYREVAS